MQKLPPPQKNIKTKIRGVQSAMPKKNAGKNEIEKFKTPMVPLALFLRCLRNSRYHNSRDHISRYHKSRYHRVFSGCEKKLESKTVT